MDCSKLNSQACGIARGLAVVGDAWSSLILRDASQGMTQFDQFRTSLGIAPNILSRRLKSLTDGGLLEKRAYSQKPPRDEYVLTKSGRDFIPILVALGEWGRRYNGEGKLSHLVNADTGVRVQPVVIDKKTGKVLTDMAIRVVMPQ